MSGNEYTDNVSFGGLSVASQSIGAANATVGFDYGVDGIIGFGPVGLTQRTVSNANTVPTFMNNLYKQGSIPSEVLGVYFKPEAGSGTADTNGALTLGGIDSSKFKGPLTLFPRLKTGLASPYWGISIARFSYGSTVLAASGTGYVDTGTTSSTSQPLPTICSWLLQVERLTTTLVWPYSRRCPLRTSASPSVPPPILSRPRSIWSPPLSMAFTVSPPASTTPGLMMVGAQV